VSVWMQNEGDILWNVNNFSKNLKAVRYELMNKSKKDEFIYEFNIYN
jgi:hypothetical protein